MGDRLHRSDFSDKGVDAESRLFLVLPKNSGFYKYQETKTSSREAGEEIPRRERPEEAASTTTGSGSTERSAKYWHESQRVKTLSRGVKAAREGTPQNVRFDTPFLTGERVQSVKNGLLYREERKQYFRRGGKNGVSA